MRARGIELASVWLLLTAASVGVWALVFMAML